MSCELTWCLGKGTNVEGDPFYEDIVTAISLLRPVRDDFVILGDNEHEQNNIFIQTLMSDMDEDDNEGLFYLVETRFEPSIDGSGRDFTQHRTFLTEKADVLQLFGQYYTGKAIDVSGWKDITTELIEELKAKHKKEEDQ